jgi:hypothetical protein
VPFAAGKRWIYDVNSTNTAVIAGVSQTKVDDERLLYVNGAVTWQGRAAWQVTQYDRPKAPTGAAGFIASTLYLAQDSNGLDLWVPSGAGGWAHILSTQSASFDGTFLMAGAPAQGHDLHISGPAAVAVPLGSYNAVDVSHKAVVTGQFAAADISEERHEYYGDNVGLVRATWGYSVDNNDPQAADTSSTGSINLTTADTGPNVVNEAEPNDLGSETGAQAVAVGDIVTGQTQDGDAGQVLTDSNVGANKSGQKLLQDWYKLVTSSTGAHHVVLKYTNNSTLASQPDDLDLYLFREAAGGGLTFVQRSVLDPTTPEGAGMEWIHAENLPAGTYFVAVQAWATPGGKVSYWLSIQ